MAQYRWWPSSVLDPQVAEIARNNQTIFEETQKEYDIHYCEIRYITFAHDEATYNDLERSCGWSNAYLIDKKDFQKEVSPTSTRIKTPISPHKSPSIVGKLPRGV